MADLARSHVIDGASKRAYLALLAAERGPEVVATPEIVVSLDAEAVADVERELGLRFDPAVLLLFAVVDVFGMYDLDLARLPSLRNEAEAASVPASLVPLGRDGHEWICVERRAAAARIVVYLDDDQSRRSLPVADWLDEVVEQHLHGSDPTDAERRALEAWMKKATLEVRMTAADRTPRSFCRVRHPKFGEGVVRREERSGADTKLEIDFGQAGVRVLLSRFVERLPS
ncbi:hypothetical protein SAMN02745121_03962 [Nannocystis exedens]|uniref:Uncharacterized protein n=1 Tax=Nannocystis exedens TaxID=54 RepID=A0A1I1ZU57_9BACT|nr:hypothetical protein [Nannocystis exedens]PCC75315.1 hypothetical protein NAEX_08424 [Nannocystis exedens]SFE35155.1 hypothetical protein SAMN02745121_03962 [Nannocystis exedens]